jgi:hypothetical protein
LKAELMTGVEGVSRSPVLRIVLRGWLRPRRPFSASADAV